MFMTLCVLQTNYTDFSKNSESGVFQVGVMLIEFHSKMSTFYGDLHWANATYQFHKSSE